MCMASELKDAAIPYKTRLTVADGIRLERDGNRDIWEALKLARNRLDVRLVTSFA